MHCFLSGWIRVILLIRIRTLKTRIQIHPYFLLSFTQKVPNWQGKIHRQSSVADPDAKDPYHQITSINPLPYPSFLVPYPSSTLFLIPHSLSLIPHLSPVFL